MGNILLNTYKFELLGNWHAWHSNLSFVAGSQHAACIVFQIFLLNKIARYTLHDIKIEIIFPLITLINVHSGIIPKFTLQNCFSWFIFYSCSNCSHNFTNFKQNFFSVALGKIDLAFAITISQIVHELYWYSNGVWSIMIIQLNMSHMTELDGGLILHRQCQCEISVPLSFIQNELRKKNAHGQ